VVLWEKQNVLGNLIPLPCLLSKDDIDCLSIILNPDGKTPIKVELQQGGHTRPHHGVSSPMLSSLAIGATQILRKMEGHDQG